MLEILGHLKHINFSFGTNGKLMTLGVPILKHFRVFSFFYIPEMDNKEKDASISNYLYILK